MSGFPIAVQLIPLVLSIGALVEARRAVNLSQREEYVRPPATDRFDRLIGEIMDWEAMHGADDRADTLDWEDEEE